MATNKNKQLAKKYIADRKLLKEHFYKTFVQISVTAWQ